MSVHYQTISHTENQILQFFPRSKKLNYTEFSKQCDKNSFKQMESGGRV